MKNRYGFISNSSSTSFIIAVKKDVCRHCGRPALDIVREIEILQAKVSDDDYNIKAKGKKDVLSAMTDWFFAPDELKRTKEHIKTIDENEYELLYITISMHDIEFTERLYKTKDVIVISKESE